MARISVFGTGYVGLVTGVCLAALDHTVVCCDIDQKKIAQLSQGFSTIHEPELSSLLTEQLRRETLFFTSDFQQAIQHGEILFIAVGTPSGKQGEADLSALYNVLSRIATERDENCLIVHKSTVPIGTAAAATQYLEELRKQHQRTFIFEIISHPEFLREGSAVRDFMHPDRIVIGAKNISAAQQIAALYKNLSLSDERIFLMTQEAAELTKYAANALLATKISFMNEMSGIAEFFGIDILDVRDAIGADLRIGHHFLNPGPGFGGSCFPKDLRALHFIAENTQISTPLLHAVSTVNTQQKEKLFQKFFQFFDGDICHKTVAIWGLAFKAGTDDIRESPSLTLINALLLHDVSIQAFDPAAMDNARAHFSGVTTIHFCQTPTEAAHQADALFILTEWEIFQAIDLLALKNTLKNPVIFDGRNLYDPISLKNAGFRYFGIGHGETMQQQSNKGN